MGEGEKQTRENLKGISCRAPWRDLTVKVCRMHKWLSVPLRAGSHDSARDDEREKRRQAERKKCGYVDKSCVAAAAWSAADWLRRC